MIEQLEDVINNYKGKVRHLNEMLKENRSDKDIERLKAKRSTYKSVITDLLNIIESHNN